MTEVSTKDAVRDLSLCVPMAVIVLVFWVNLGDIPSPGDLVPKAALTCIAGATLFIAGRAVWRLTRSRVANGVRSERREGEAIKRAILEARPVAYTLIGLIVYVYLIPMIGLFASTAIFLPVMYWVLRGAPRRPRTLGSILLVAFIVTVLAYFIFDVQLRISTPSGLLF